MLVMGLESSLTILSSLLLIWSGLRKGGLEFVALYVWSLGIKRGRSLLTCQPFRGTAEVQSEVLFPWSPLAVKRFKESGSYPPLAELDLTPLGSLGLLVRTEAHYFPLAVPLFLHPPLCLPCLFKL